MDWNTVFTCDSLISDESSLHVWYSGAHFILLFHLYICPFFGSRRLPAPPTPRSLRWSTVSTCTMRIQTWPRARPTSSPSRPHSRPSPASHSSLTSRTSIWPSHLSMKRWHRQGRPVRPKAQAAAGWAAGLAGAARLKSELDCHWWSLICSCFFLVFVSF